LKAQCRTWPTSKLNVDSCV